ncbi:MAG: hypothetical protein FWH21_00215 [Kiritimatiellaeota bacterium]|nr:hypothetical protein [Kiritimatiellota bacterium]
MTEGQKDTRTDGRVDCCTDTGGCPAWLFAVVMLAALVILALTEGEPEPCYPDPVCEMCGQVLDGSHTPWCTPEWEAEGK